MSVYCIQCVLQWSLFIDSAVTERVIDSSLRPSRSILSPAHFIHTTHTEQIQEGDKNEKKARKVKMEGKREERTEVAEIGKCTVKFE